MYRTLLLLSSCLAAAAVAQPMQRRMQMGPAMDGGMPCCQMMMSGGMTPEMKAELDAQEARLDQKVAAMNAAKGNAKIDATAAALTELVAQRKQMRQRMAQQRQQMMKHMAECPMAPMAPDAGPAKGPVKK